MNNFLYILQTKAHSTILLIRMKTDLMFVKWGLPVSSLHMFSHEFYNFFFIFVGNALYIKRNLIVVSPYKDK